MLFCHKFALPFLAICWRLQKVHTFGMQICLGGIEALWMFWPWLEVHVQVVFVSSFSNPADSFVWLLCSYTCFLGWESRSAKKTKILRVQAFFFFFQLAILDGFRKKTTRQSSVPTQVLHSFYKKNTQNFWCVFISTWCTDLLVCCTKYFWTIFVFWSSYWDLPFSVGTSSPHPRCVMYDFRSGTPLPPWIQMWAYQIHQIWSAT